MSILLFQSIFSASPSYHLTKPVPLPLACSYVSPNARLAVEGTPCGISYGTVKRGSVSVCVGLSIKGELRLPSSTPVPDWQGKEMGYPPRNVLIRQMSVRKLSVPVTLGWWLARCHRRVTLPLVVMLERTPGPVVLPSPAFTEGLVALRIDGTDAVGAATDALCLLDCESQLAALRHVRAVTLLGRTQQWFPRLAALAQLPALRTLVLGLADLRGIEWVAKCRALRALHISGCLSKISLRPLAMLRGLHVVSLEASDVRDVAPLASLRSLRVLRVQFASFLQELDVVGELPSLEVLDVTNNVRLVSVSGLRGSPRLRWVSLRDCPIADITAVAALPSLRYLDCSECDNLVRLPALSEVPHLREIDLTRSAIVHLDGLLGSERLTRVTAGHCYNLVNLNGLREATELVELDICDTPITSLDPLVGAACLRKLVAHSTGIQNLTGLAKCRCLEILDVHNCQELLEVNAVSELKSLKTVNVRGCRRLRDVDALLRRSSRSSGKVIVLHD